jgi:hypothetical protein
VFDGPGRPWKRGRHGQGRINYEERRLLKELLKYFRIPYHEAPGEAEAECARLQQLEVVDAVFSQDSDTLMFGCSVLVRDDRVAKEKGNNDRSKENTTKSGKSVRVSADQIQRVWGSALVTYPLSGNIRTRASTATQFRSRRARTFCHAVWRRL